LGIGPAKSALACAMVTLGFKRAIPCMPKPARVALVAIELEGNEQIELHIGDAKAPGHDAHDLARARIDN
jgi:hypothetical protein